MAQLTKVVVDAISLVKAGANGEPIQIYKSLEGGGDNPEGDQNPGDTINISTDTEIEKGETKEGNTPGTSVEEKAQEEALELPETSETIEEETLTIDKSTQGTLRQLFKPLLKALGLSNSEEGIEKASDIDTSVDWTSFTSRMTDPESRIWDALDTLRWTMNSIFWNDTIDNGKELILNNIDEFKSYVEDVLNSERAITFFEKEDETMKKEDIEKAIADALDPVSKSLTTLTEQIAALEKSAEPVEETTPVEEIVEEPIEKGADPTEETPEDLSSVIKTAISDSLEPVSKSLKELGDRLNTLETAKGISKGGQISGSKVEKANEDLWPEIRIPGLG